MKVWIFQTGEPLQSDNGNPRPMRAINLANVLVDRGHVVTLWSSGFYHQKKVHRSKNFEKIIINNKLEIRLIPSPGYKHNVSFSRMFDHLILALNLKKKIALEKLLPDVAFIGFPPVETAYVMSRWLKKKKIPYMLDVKDKWPQIFVERMPKFFQFFLRLILSPYYLLTKKTMRESTSICSMSDSFLNWSLDFSNREITKFDMVAPLTSLNDKLADKEEQQALLWWAKKGIKKNNISRVIFVGSFSKVFDFDLIFEVANDFFIKQINCEFILCGNGELDLYLKIKSMKYHNIKVVEWIDSFKFSALSKISLAFIAPYKNTSDFTKSVPNKIIDAFRLGMPLLSSLRGEVESLITTYKTGFFYSNSASLAMNIKLLIDDKDLYKNLSNNSKKLYNEKFEFYKVYNNLISNLENLKKANNER